MGGSNDEDNITLLTIEEHAEAHRLLWEKNGRHQDKRACKSLYAKTEESEVTRLKSASKTYNTLSRVEKIRNAMLRRYENDSEREKSSQLSVERYKDPEQRLQ